MPKAAAHLQTRVFSRLSEPHVIALALLPALSDICAQAYRTAQVIQADYVTQDAALRAHLQALELPLNLSNLSERELGQLIQTWEGRTYTLPHPLRACVETLLDAARDLTLTNRS